MTYLSSAESARLDVDDLSALCDESTRMGWSLACLIGAMESGDKIAWCEENQHGNL